MDNFKPSWFDKEEKIVPEKPEVVVPQKNMRAILTEKIENIIEDGGEATVSGINVSDFSFVHGKYRRSHRHTVNISLEGDTVKIVNLVNNGKKETSTEL